MAQAQLDQLQQQQGLTQLPPQPQEQFHLQPPPPPRGKRFITAQSGSERELCIVDLDESLLIIEKYIAKKIIYW